MYNQYMFAEDICVSVKERATKCLEDWDCIGRGRAVHIELLPGGANNVNLVVAVDSDRWALKIRDPGSEDFNNAALAEAVSGQIEAAHLGVAPRILAHSADGDFISEFLVGETLRPEAIRTKHYARPMVEALQKLHSSSFAPRRLDLFDDIRVFLRGAEEVGGELPDEFGAFWDLAQSFEVALNDANPPRSFVHGDLVPQNFMFCQDGVKLVDFDYCGQSLVAVDLACATSQAEMTAEETEAFLRLYDPQLDDSQQARVSALQFVNALREVSWAAMAEPRVGSVTTLLEGWSYKRHAEINLALARKFTVSNHMEEVIEVAGYVRQDALF